MNEHLQPVFGVLLPELKREGIGYWVYGGVGIAAVARKFFRDNGDVDIFVVGEPDHKKAKLVLDTACRQNDICKQKGYTVTPCKRLRSGRPKFEVIAMKETDKDKKEVLSVVAVYRKDGLVEFRFDNNKLAQYCDQILDPIHREICGYSFFSPPNKWIKELFKTYLRNKPKKKKSEKIQKDAQKILNLEERQELQIPELTGKGG